jgi:hypothetical protein
MDLVRCLVLIFIIVFLLLLDCIRSSTGTGTGTGTGIYFLKGYLDCIQFDRHETTQCTCAHDKQTVPNL